jgi:DNA cross-link repair 1A protein
MLCTLGNGIGRHIAADHYQGLSDTWDAGPVYCNDITADLAIHLTGLRPDWLVRLPMDTPTDVMGVLPLHLCCQ